MTKFMVLYRSSTSPRDQMASAGPEQMKAGMEAWMQWAGKAGDAVVDLGAPLAPAAHVGPGSSDAGQISGYSIMQADSAGALGGVLDGHPYLSVPGNSIEVPEMLSIPPFCLGSRPHRRDRMSACPEPRLRQSAVSAA
jgi:hypothetical protein